MFVLWADMVRAGLLALQFYTPATGSWGQAHMHARYAILRVRGMREVQPLTKPQWYVA